MLSHPSLSSTQNKNIPGIPWVVYFVLLLHARIQKIIVTRKSITSTSTYDVLDYTGRLYFIPSNSLKKKKTQVQVKYVQMTYDVYGMINIDENKK